MDNVKETCWLCGVNYAEFLEQDPRAYKALTKSYLRRRESEINDRLQSYPVLAEKIAQAVWGDRGFSKKIKYVHLVNPPAPKTPYQTFSYLDSLIDKAFKRDKKEVQPQ